MERVEKRVDLWKERTGKRKNGGMKKRRKECVIKYKINGTRRGI